MYKRLFFAGLLALLSLAGCVQVHAQLFATMQETPVRWTSAISMTSRTQGTVTVKAAITPGWHLYGLEMPEDGPRATEINLTGSTGVEFTGELTPSREPVSKTDAMFGAELTWWDADVTFTRTFTVTNPDNARIAGSVTFMACDDITCRPPSTINFTLNIPKK